jgi:hypothetical protein
VSIETAIFEALRGLVSDRCYPVALPQHCLWPAIRYSFVSLTPYPDACGDDAAETAQQRVQVDIVGKAYGDVRQIRRQVLTAMRTLDPPAIVAGAFDDYDSDAKAYRSSIDYLLHPSG